MIGRYGKHRLLQDIIILLVSVCDLWIHLVMMYAQGNSAFFYYCVFNFIITLPFFILSLRSVIFGIIDLIDKYKIS